MCLMIRRISSLVELNELRPSWERLSPASVFCTWQWQRIWADAHIKSEQLYVLVAETQAGQVRGIFPFMRETSQIEGRVLRLLGSGAVRSEGLGIIVDADYRNDVAQAMSEWLASMALDPSNRWDSVSLENVCPNDRTIALILESLESFGVSINVESQHTMWRSDVPRSWEDYWAMRSQADRDAWTSYQRTSGDSGRACFASCDCSSTVMPGIRTLISLHQKQSYHEYKCGRFVGGQFTRFLTMAAPRMIADGTGRLYQFNIDDQTVASSFHLIQGNTAFELVSGIDPAADFPSLPQQFSTEIIRDLIESPTEFIGAYHENKTYVNQLGGETHSLVNVRLSAPTNRTTMLHQLAKTHVPSMLNRKPARRRSNSFR